MLVEEGGMLGVDGCWYKEQIWSSNFQLKVVINRSRPIY
jgi:hypothetical protein